MNWGKVNGILIGAFLLINICLALILSNGDTKTRYEVTGNRLTELQINLDRYNIAMYDFIPNYAPMQRLGVQRKSIEIEQIIQNVFGDKPYWREQNNNIIIYRANVDSLTFFGNKVDKDEFVYNSKLEEIEVLEHGETAIKKYGDSLIKKIMGKNSNLKLYDFKRNKDDSYEIRYIGYYEGIAVFGSYFSININANGEVIVTIKYIEVKSLIKEKHYLVEPEEMLYNVGERIKDAITEQTIIMKIEIGYDAGIRKFEDLKKDYIEPYYRVELIDGKVFYVNAYTNEIVN